MLRAVAALALLLAISPPALAGETTGFVAQQGGLHVAWPADGSVTPADDALFGRGSAGGIEAGSGTGFGQPAQAGLPAG